MADVVYVVDKGMDLVTALLVASNIKYVGWGTGGNTSATATDIGLTAAATEARVSGTQTLQTTSTTNDTYQVTATITCTGAAKAIDEVGIFDAITSGNMFFHATFDDVNLSIGDSITFTLKAQYNQV